MSTKLCRKPKFDQYFDALNLHRSQVLFDIENESLTLSWLGYKNDALGRGWGWESNCQEFGVTQNPFPEA